MTQTSSYQKPGPIPDEASQPFYDGARDHRLLIQQCATCGVVIWLVKSHYDNCMQPTVNWVQASGKATLYSFALMHQVNHPGCASEIPYSIAQVDLQEGLRILTNIVDCSSSDLQIGTPQEVTFEATTDEVTLPKFRPV